MNKYLNKILNFRKFCLNLLFTYIVVHSSFSNIFFNLSHTLILIIQNTLTQFRCDF